MTFRSRSLPQFDERPFLTDGGMETTLIFHQGVDLPMFAAFPLLLSAEGRAHLETYMTPFLTMAAERDVGFILDTPTWRANPAWGAKLGYSLNAIENINRDAIAWARRLRNSHGLDGARVLIEGAIGPRGDGYQPDSRMSVDEARFYHSVQVRAFRDAGADMVGGFTLNYAEEAIGIAQAAVDHRIPVVVSFTVETDGNLASGETLRAAIERVDGATGGAPAYFMINCAHPSHFDSVLGEGGSWTDRIRGVRANASAKSHAELDESTEIDIGDPIDLGRRYDGLRRKLRNLSVFGGCCGTDHRHVLAICDACLPATEPAS